MRPQIAFVSNEFRETKTVINAIRNRFDFEELYVIGLSKFFNLFNNTDFRISLVVFDINCLQTENYTDVFEVLNTVETLIKVNHIQTRPVISVAANSNTPADVLRNIMTTDIKGLLWDFDNLARVEEQFHAFDQLLNGKIYVAREVTDKIKPVKKHSQNKSLNKVNGISLTLRQEQILNLICTRGSSNKNIARILNLSESTVKLHIGAILKKYGLKNRTQLALFTKNHYQAKNKSP